MEAETGVMSFEMDEETTSQKRLEAKEGKETASSQETPEENIPAYPWLFIQWNWFLTSHVQNTQVNEFVLF